MRQSLPLRVFSVRLGTDFSPKHAPIFFRRLRRALLVGLFLYGLLSVVGCLVVFMSWERGLGSETPTSYGLDYREVSFNGLSDNITLRGWFIPAKSEKAIIMVHGHGSNRADREVYTLRFAADLHRAGYNVLTFDLRGHGRSDGFITSFGQEERKDVLGAWGYLRQAGFEPQHIGIWGWSMGAATTLLAMDDVQGREMRVALLDSGYADLNSQFESSLAGFPGLLVPGLEVAGQALMGVSSKEVRPSEALSRLHDRRLFLVHGANDTTVPPWNLAVLVQAGGSNVVETWLVPNAGHALAYRSRPAEYAARAIAFFNKEL